MHSLWFVQWDSTRRDHLGNLGRVSGPSPVIERPKTRRKASFNKLWKKKGTQF